MRGIDETRPRVVVYTHSLLEPSMTFVLSHAEALKRYQAVYAGARRVTGLSLPADKVYTANRGGISGRVAEFMFRRFRIPGRLATDLGKLKPAVVHAHFGLCGPAGLTLARSLRVPLVVTYHGQDATITDEEARRSWRGREYLRGRLRVMKEASVIVAVSEFIRGRLLSKGYPEEKVVTHYNGIDVRYFRMPEGPREPMAVFVGRFVEKKGCEYLLRAAGLMKERGRSARVKIIGDGPLGPQLKKLAFQVGADAEFTGFLPLCKVREQIGAASVIVVPSVTASNGDSEGLPTVILEAQAMGTPVVATRHAGNSEGLSEGRSAILVPERDIPSLADAIGFFIENPGAVRSFGLSGRSLVEARFDITRQVAGLEEIYDRAQAECKS